MAKFFTFAGNLTTGEIVCNTEPVELACDIEDSCSALLDRVGWENAVWAAYDSRNSIEACAADFKEYMKFRGSSPVKVMIISDIGTEKPGTV